jgi:glycosyltransferase involved in cell wall biosynthesis
VATTDTPPDTSGSIERADAPLVSVIIPTFNRSDVLPRALQSGLAQVDQKDIEFIVVDDASTDETAQVVAKIGDPRIRYVRIEENVGGSGARNRGLWEARGRFVAFLDSDDTWEPQKLKVQLGAALERPNHDEDVFFTQVRVDRGFHSEVCPRRGKADDESVGDYLFTGGGLIQTSSLFVPAALARRVMFDPDLRKHQDYDFCLRLEQHGARFRFIEQPLVVWRHDRRSERISSRYGVEVSEQFLKIWRSRMSLRASTAFYIDVILLAKVRERPFFVARRLIGEFLWGALPLMWFFRKLRTGVTRSFAKWMARDSRRSLPTDSGS